ncbi:MAG: PKD domain-containing protein, partial [candidate division Zixibacteria bacterium]|nr:PKD domain-containing protein [candidate division Zixibacteria bacterium]
MNRIKQIRFPLYSIIMLIIISGTLLTSGNVLADTANTDNLLCPPPVADFRYKITPDCDSAVAEFFDLSTGTITTREWDFGDGTTSSLQNPVHIYDTPGIYMVTLIVTGPYGADTVSKPVTVTLLPYPISDFLAIPDSGSVSLRVYFIDRSINATSILWRFGDGSTSIERDPIHTYSSPGTYTAWQIVTNICGPDSTWKDIKVTEGLHADFGYPDTICIYNSVQFKDLSTGNITNWFWDFGDGGTSNAQNPWHTYTALGMYDVSLTVYGPGGSDDTTKYDYILVIGPPTPKFTAVPDSGNVPLIVHFTDQSIDADTVIWRFGDGDTSIAINPSHTYRQVGTYTAWQIVANECGRDSTDREIKVTQWLHADFGYPDTICVDSFVQFTDLSTPVGEITGWSWNFGDGGTSIEQNPRHTYTVVGTYDVSLAVTGSAGFDDTIKYNYIVVEGLAVAGFTADKTSGRVPLTVQFTNQAVDDTLIIWRFGDGDTSLALNPSHTYTSPGTYTAWQIVENECCRDSDYVIIEVQGLHADFGYPDTICVDSFVQFVDLSTPVGEITGWSWTFGDGSTSIEQNPKHTYTAVGIYDVSLTVTGPLGSDDTTKYDYILVIDKPTAAFTPDRDFGPRPLTVNFTNHSIGADSVFWNFGDNTTDTALNPTHVYTDTGTYYVKMTVTNKCGEDTAEHTIRVLERTGELTISKLVDKPFAEAGEVLTYFVALINTGDETVYNVEISDTIPDTTVFVTGSAQDDPVYGGDAVVYHGFNNDIYWTVDSIVIGQSLMMQFQVTVDNDAPNGHVVVNRASIIGPPPYNGWAEAQTTILAPEITLTKVADPTIAKRGDTVRYTVRAYNNGDSPVLAAYLVDDIPDVFDYIVNSCEVNHVAVTPTGADTLNIDVGDIGIDDSVVITYLVEITSQADTGATYRNFAMLYEGNGGTRSPNLSLAGRSWGPVWADVSLITPPLLVEKKAGKASALPGDIVPYLITVTNTSPATAENVIVIDTMPAGFIYIPQTSVINDLPAPDPVGDNPFEWSLGDLASGESATIMYAIQVSTQAKTGINDNVVWAFANLFRPSRAEARVMVLSQKFEGTIRGRLIVDCDGDFNPDTDEVPVGVDIYLDDGYQSHSNEKGMFYFSAVRAGEHAVKIDKRDLKALGYHLIDDQTEAVFCHVHEMGESYIIFRICPDQPVLSVLKEAAILPRARVTKTARIDTTLITDTTGITVDYEIDIESNGGADPTL